MVRPESSVIVTIYHNGYLVERYTTGSYQTAYKSAEADLKALGEGFTYKIVCL